MVSTVLDTRQQQQSPRKREEGCSRRDEGVPQPLAMVDDRGGPNLTPLPSPNLTRVVQSPSALPTTVVLTLLTSDWKAKAGD